jgi:hypothetical protein
MGGAAFSRYPSSIWAPMMGIAKALHPSYFAILNALSSRGVFARDLLLEYTMHNEKAKSRLLVKATRNDNLFGGVTIF